MLNSVGFLSLFRVVPPVHGAHQITGDPTDALEGNRLKAVVQIHKVAVYRNIHAAKFPVWILFPRPADIRLLLGQRNFATRYLYRNHLENLLIKSLCRTAFMRRAQNFPLDVCKKQLQMNCF